MRATHHRMLTVVTRRTVAALGLAGALILTGCSTQVAGTAVAPSTSSTPSSAPTVQSMPGGVTDEPTSSDEATSSAEPTSSDEPTSSAEPSSSDEASSSDEPSASGAPSSDSTAPDSSTASGPTIDPAAFAAKLKAANAGVKTLKGTIAVDAGEAKVSGSFGETLAAGRVSALDMSMFISQGSTDIPLRMLIVGGKVYLGGDTVLKSLNAGTKKWALASTSSANATLRTLATQLNGYLDTASANQYELYAAAAKSIVDEGPERVAGVSAHRYDVTVDVAALAKEMPASARTSIDALSKAGVTTLPTVLWLDDSNRLVQSESTVKVSGVTSKSTFKVVGYNVPVSIKAPAAADVYTG